MDILDFVLIALAADAMITAWFYGSIFKRPWDYFDKRAEKGSLLGELFTCSLCLPYHVAFWTTVGLWLPGLFLPAPWNVVSRVPIYALAATTVVHFLQGERPFKEEDDDSEGSADDGGEDSPPVANGK